MLAIAQRSGLTNLAVVTAGKVQPALTFQRKPGNQYSSRQPGHRSSDCTEPRSAEGVECKKCHEGKHGAHQIT